MSNTMHTPGPWAVNTYITKNATNPRQVTVIATGMTIRVSGLLQHQDANANLIAAAPDLLAACEAFCNVYDFERKELRTTKTARDWDTVVSGIVTAIAAAKGEK